MRPYDKAGKEPRLHEMLEDPVILGFMAKDGVSKQQIVELMSAASMRFQSELPAEILESCTFSDFPPDRPLIADCTRQLCCA